MYRVDGVRTRLDIEGTITKKLAILKQKIHIPRIISGQEFLGFWKRFLFARGLILSRGWYRPFAIFAAGSALLLILLWSLQIFDSSVRASKQILGTATTGFEFLEAGKFNLALQSFEQISRELENSHEALFKILKALPGTYNKDNLLATSQEINKALIFARQGLVQFQDLRLVWDPVSNSSDQQLYQYLKKSRESLVQSQTHLRQALTFLSGINPELFPSVFREPFRKAYGGTLLGQKTVDLFVSFETAVLNLLGGEDETYLLIFQNNNEARATGGFIGTYGLLDFANGQMKIRKIESIYALDGQLKEKIAAPGPLSRQVTSDWGLRDSNWFVDFPTSCRKMLEFLEKESGVLAQGVISFTPDVFEKLLVLTGPVPMPEYGETLSAENFRSIVQEKTSYDYDRELNQPKKFLADFAPRFLAKLQDLDQAKSLEILQILSQMIEEKQLLLFSLDPSLQETIRDFQADGRIKQIPGDYLAIYHSNVGGGKTDQNLLQKVEKKVSIDSSGLAIVRLVITRTHQGFDEKYFPKNLDYLRILVPPQAELLAASGFDDFILLPSRRDEAKIDPDLASWESAIKRDDLTGMYIGEEAGYKVFSNWIELSPGQTKSLELTYEIQFASGKAYTTLVQKQPGSLPFEFSLEINYLPGKVAYFYPETFLREGSHLKIVETLDRDRFYGLVGE